MKRRARHLTFGVAGGLLIACAVLWPILTRPRATLVSLEEVTFSTAPCFSSPTAVKSGLQMKVVTAWIDTTDVVGVIGDYARQGYAPISIMSDSRDSTELLQREADVFGLLVAQARIRRAVSLSYTPDFATRIIAISTLVVCLP